MKALFSFFEFFLICFGGYAKFCEICCYEFDGAVCPGIVLGYHRERGERFKISVTGSKFFQKAENFYKQKRLQLEDLREMQIRLQKNPMALLVAQTCQQVVSEERKNLEEAYKRLSSLCCEVHKCDYKTYVEEHSFEDNLIEF